MAIDQMKVDYMTVNKIIAIKITRQNDCRHNDY
jgi:hypothetical protein